MEVPWTSQLNGSTVWVNSFRSFKKTKQTKLLRWSYSVCGNKMSITREGFPLYFPGILWHMKYSLILATVKNDFGGAESDKNAKGYKITVCEGRLKGWVVPLQTWGMWLLSAHTGRHPEAGVGGVSTEVQWISVLKMGVSRDFTGGPGVKCLPASVGVTGSVPGPERSHMLRSNYWSPCS